MRNRAFSALLLTCVVAWGMLAAAVDATPRRRAQKKVHGKATATPSSSPLSSATPTASPINEARVESTATAVDEPRTELFLDSVIYPTFVPREVFFFVAFDQGPGARVRGVFVPARIAGERSKGWYIGLKIRVPRGKKRVTYSSMTIGPAHSFHVEPAVTRPIDRQDPFGVTGDSLFAHRAQRVEVLRSLEVQLKAQAETIARLRSDAEVIGNLGRIIEAKEELQKVTIERRNVERDIANLQAFLKLARSRPIPKNYVSREGFLTRQISELAEAARVAESNEVSRRSRALADLQRKLGIVESTRYDDYADLERTLARLKKRRAQLERGDDEGTVDENR